MLTRREIRQRAALLELWQPQLYALSAHANIDDQVAKRNDARAFWRASTPRQAAGAASADAAPAALGKATKTQAASSDLRSVGDGVYVDSATGELSIVETVRGRARVVPDVDDRRAERFRLQTRAGKLLPRSRTAQCLRRVQSGGSTVQVCRDREHGAVHFGGLTVCGSVWACPVCAAKISERRRTELQGAISAHRAEGGNVYLVTYTVPHSREDDLPDMLSRLREAVARMKSHRSYKRLRATCGQVGTVRALEVTHGSNGWHPHIHELWFASSPPDQSQLLRCWLAAAVASEFSAPSDVHGVDVRGGDFAADYAAKWGLESELVKATSKRGGRGSSSPFDLLRRSDGGDSRAGALFVVYANAFHGSRQLVWSRGLRQLFGLVDVSDEELAQEPIEHSDVIGELTFPEWRAVCRAERVSGRPCRFELLRLAAVDWSAAADYVESLLFDRGGGGG